MRLLSLSLVCPLHGLLFCLPFGPHLEVVLEQPNDGLGILLVSFIFDLVDLFHGHVYRLLSHLLSSLLVVQALVGENGEVQSDTQSYWVC